MKTPRGFQRFKKSGFFFCVYVWWLKNGNWPPTTFSCLSSKQAYTTVPSAPDHWETDESACSWSKPSFPSSSSRWPPWVGFCFSLLISTFTLQQRIRSQTCVYQCLAFLTVLVTSLAREKLEVFHIKGIWGLSVSSHSSTQSQVSGLWVVSQGLHPRICTRDAKGSLGNCWAVLGSLRGPNHLTCLLHRLLLREGSFLG